MGTVDVWDNRYSGILSEVGMGLEVLTCYIALGKVGIHEGKNRGRYWGDY
jgi:hypothetical protein